MKTGIDFITLERERQLGMGYTPEHDTQYTEGELLRAAGCYMRSAQTTISVRIDGACDDINFTRPLRDPQYPWNPLDFKPNPDDPIDDLARMGAFCAAEIDRLLRHPKLAPVAPELEEKEV